MQQTINISTDRHEGLYDITENVKDIVRKSGISTGIVNIFVRHATAAIMIQENWDESVRNDVVRFLAEVVPPGIWEHDHQDNNGDSHSKSGLIGPSETIPVMDGLPALGRWQNIFLCEFDGPRQDRKICVTVMGT